MKTIKLSDLTVSNYKLSNGEEILFKLSSLSDSYDAVYVDIEDYIQFCLESVPSVSFKDSTDEEMTYLRLYGFINNMKLYVTTDSKSGEILAKPKVFN